MDFNTTFLNGNLEENVFMEILEGFEGHGNPYLVYKLRRALYGLHQPPQAWYNHIDEELTLIEHKKCSIDFNLVGKGKYVILLFYINDLPLVKNTIQKLEIIKNTFTNTFEMTLLRNVSLFLEVEII
jgi:hypothetical protein